jgi:hypothetical protein
MAAIQGASEAGESPPWCRTDACSSTAVIRSERLLWTIDHPNDAEEIVEHGCHRIRAVLSRFVGDGGIVGARA